MPADTILALVALTCLMAWTPGPNNAMVASSGATFGFRRTFPHVLGIALGFSFMILVVGYLLGAVFQASVLLREGVRWLGAALLLYIAWKIATSGGLSSARGEPRPLTFLEAAGFQWVNPKAWTGALAITAQFATGAAPLTEAVVIGVVCVLTGLTSASTWALGGQAIRRFLATPERLRAFNIAMGLLIAGCVGLLFLG